VSAILLRIIIIAVIFAVIAYGMRRIWRDWTGVFRAEDKARHQRDLKERQRPDVITLKRSEDGVFRPGDDDQR
jgi:hypothetical protein